MNLLYLHAHDLGRCLPAHGYPVEAPHLETFRQRPGTRCFANAHSAAPTCSPSRAALLTGRYPHECGMLGLMHRGFRLHEGEEHLASHLQKQGFETALAGIQHIQPGEELQGYDRRFHPVKRTTKEGRVDWGGWDWEVAESAAGYLREAHESPFFLDCGFWWPHRPFPEESESWQAPPPLDGIHDSPAAREDFGAFHSAIRHLDRCCGLVLEALEESGRMQDTLVLFTTDHGPAFPEHKCRLTSRGTGVAMMLRPPSEGAPGRGPSSIDAPVSQLDLFPTICDYLGVDSPTWSLRGESLRPLMEGAPWRRRDALFGEVTFHAGYEPMRSIRTEEYLLVKVFEEDLRPVPANVDDSACKEDWIDAGGWENQREPISLYDLKKDSRELCNLADDPAYAVVREQLESQLDSWMRETQDPLREGEVVPPEGAYVNEREHRSATIGEP